MVERACAFLKSLKAEEIGPVCSMLLGFSAGVGWATVRDALLKVTGMSGEDLFEAFNQTGDLGEASKILFTRRRVKTVPLLGPLTISEVWGTLKKLSFESSLERKKRLVEGLLNRCSPAEAKLLVKILTGEMRAGFGEGLLRQTLAKAYGVSEEEVKRACAFGSTAEVGATLSVGTSIQSFVPRLFQPISPMLAESARDVAQALKEHGGKTYMEFKLDGARVQVHVSGEKIAVFSRSREEVGQYMLEIREQVRRLRLREAILDGEIIATRDGSPLPFQFLMRKFRRKKGGAEEISVKLQFFDLLFWEGKPMFNEPYVARREKLEEVVTEVVERALVGEVKEGEDFLRRAMSAGHEGVVAKMPNSPYLPGVREKSWLKIKPVHTLDLVIVGAEWGYGRRAKYLSDYYLAALDEKTGKFEVVGKTFKGLTNSELEEMTKRLKELQVSSQGRKIVVKPEIVVEVSFNQVQRSSKYPCGMALRFARIERIRDDKRPEEADTLERVRSLLA